MPNATYNIRIDARIRQEADTLYKNMGMSLSAAINLFLTQSVIQGRLPLVEVVAETTSAKAATDDTPKTWESEKNESTAVRGTAGELYSTQDTQAILDSLVGIASSVPLSLEQARNDRLARQ